MAHCARCGGAIDPDREEFLQGTRRPLTCRDCSGEQARTVLMDYSHKTAGTIVDVGSNPEDVRRAMRVYRRAR